MYICDMIWVTAIFQSICQSSMLQAPNVKNTLMLSKLWLNVQIYVQSVKLHLILLNGGGGGGRWGEYPG